MYTPLHTDHGGGNASAHASKLVGSTLADPFSAVAAAMLALQVSLSLSLRSGPDSGPYLSLSESESISKG